MRVSNDFLNKAEVPGIDMPKVADILQVLRDEGCPVFIYGGVVRDQFLGRSPNDIDVKVDCAISMVVNIYKENWGTNYCGKDTDTITHIGTPMDPKVVDLAPTTSTFYASLSQLEFTANSLAYDTDGLDVIIDLTGNGVEDVCAKKTCIPSDDNSVANWDMWKAASPEPNKIYRFWKLRSKQFKAYNEDTIDTPIGFQLKRFYCDADIAIIQTAIRARKLAMCVKLNQEQLIHTKWFLTMT